MSHELHPYVLVEALKRDEAEEAGELDSWPAHLVEIQVDVLWELRKMAREQGCSIEMILAALVRQRMIEHWSTSSRREQEE